MRNDAIGREVPWQISPSAPVSIEIENGVEDFPPRIFDFATQLFGTRQKWFNDLPLPVTQICRVRFSVHHSS
jgi:hypothetical protein